MATHVSTRKKSVDAARVYASALKIAKSRNKRARRGEVLLLLQEAAALGNVDAQYALGTWYGFGVGVRKSYRQAHHWFEKAAQGGQREARFDIAASYELGRGVAKNPRRALYWYEKVASKGDVDGRGAVEVARCFYWGIGTSRNARTAYRWYLRAARKGNPEGAYGVALAKQYGDGVARSIEGARVWFARATALGYQPHGTRDD